MAVLRRRGLSLSLSLALAVAGAGRVHAVEWDHEANLAGAVGAFVEAYEQGGMPLAEKIAAGCQDSLAAIVDDIQRLMRFEFCAGLDFAGYLTDRRDVERDGRHVTPYFTSEQVRARLERLTDYNLNPLMHQQVIQAWARSVANELDRRLK